MRCLRSGQESVDCALLRGSQCPRYRERRGLGSRSDRARNRHPQTTREGDTETRRCSTHLPAATGRTANQQTAFPSFRRGAITCGLVLVWFTSRQTRRPPCRPDPFRPSRDRPCLAQHLDTFVASAAPKHSASDFSNQGTTWFTGPLSITSIPLMSAMNYLLCISAAP